MLAGLLFGAIPVFKLRRRIRRLGPSRRRTDGDREQERYRARNLLVVAQVALALVLLVGSGLMIRTFQALRDVHPGFARPAEVQTLRLSIPDSQVKEPEAPSRMHQAIMDKVAAVPGVSSVALASTVTMSGQGWHDPLCRAGSDLRRIPDSAAPALQVRSPGYRKTMGASLVAAATSPGPTRTSCVRWRWSRRTSRASCGASRSAAIGKRVRPCDRHLARGHRSGQRHARRRPESEGADGAYWPLLMKDFAVGQGRRSAFVAAQPDLHRSQQQDRLRRLRRRTGTRGLVDQPESAAGGCSTLQEIYDASLARTSFTLVMLGIAGGMALLLGVAGIYGVISYSVSQRSREIGIRIALGAQPGSVRQMFVKHGLMLAAVGVAIGLAAAMATMRPHVVYKRRSPPGSWSHRDVEPMKALRAE